RHTNDMYYLALTCMLAVATAAPQYQFPQPSPSFSATQRAPVRTYNAPTQAPARVAAPVRTYNAPVTTAAPARRYNAPAPTSPPPRSYISPAPTAPPPRRYNAPSPTAPPARRYNAPVPTAPPPRRYNAPVPTAPPSRSYNSPAPTATPARRYNAPAATYNAPTVRIGAPVVPILRDERTMPGGDSGEYKFEFETGNGITRTEQGEELYDGGMVQEGGWQFTFPDGTPAIFTFIADKNGFQVQSDLLPVAPPMPAHALAQIEKARLEDEASSRTSASSPGRTYAAPRNTYSA
ncbi:unnamed protein product, partial [Meganyctiphanes norvegica]